MTDDSRLDALAQALADTRQKLEQTECQLEVTRNEYIRSETELTRLRLLFNVVREAVRDIRHA